MIWHHFRNSLGRTTTMRRAHAIQGFSLHLYPHYLAQIDNQSDTRSIISRKGKERGGTAEEERKSERRMRLELFNHSALPPLLFSFRISRKLGFRISAPQTHADILFSFFPGKSSLHFFHSFLLYPSLFIHASIFFFIHESKTQGNYGSKEK